MTKTIMYQKSWITPNFEDVIHKAILYLYSNCKTASMRDELAAKLSNLQPIFVSNALNNDIIPLKSYGACLKNSEWPEDLKYVPRNNIEWVHFETSFSDFLKIYKNGQ